MLSDAGQAVLFPDPAAERARIVATVSRKFPCYGAGTHHNPHNPIDVSLEHAPAQFGFGVHVADVVHVVLDLAGALLLAPKAVDG